MRYTDEYAVGGGVFEIELIRDGKSGPKVLQRREIHNTVVTSGKKKIWRIVAGLNTTENYDQMRIGTSPATPLASNVNVLSPVAASLSTVDTKSLLSGTRTLQLVISYPSGTSKLSATNIREVAVLCQLTSPGGSAMARATFTAVNKTTSDKLMTHRVIGLLAA